MTKKQETLSEEQIALNACATWDGTYTSKFGVAMRNTVYDCFNGLIQKLGKELSAAIDNPAIKGDKERIQVIKTILAKYNIYNK